MRTSKNSFPIFGWAKINRREEIEVDAVFVVVPDEWTRQYARGAEAHLAVRNDDGAEGHSNGSRGQQSRVPNWSGELAEIFLRIAGMGLCKDRSLLFRDEL